MPPTERAPKVTGANLTPVTFFSTVHPTPWAPGKGTFNRAMLESLLPFAAVRALVPVPWPERHRTPRPVTAPYPLATPTFWYLPSLAPMALASQLRWSTRRTRQSWGSRSEVILSYWTDPDGTCAVDWASDLGCGVAVMVGGSDLMVLAKDPARRARMADTLQRADHVVTIGTALAARVHDLGVAPDRITPILRGVNRSMFSPGDRAGARAELELPNDRPILLWVGRMVPVKGLTHLVAALASPGLKALNPLLIMVGDGPLRVSLEAQVQALGVADAVQFAGPAAHSTLPTWYRAADLTVLPSLSEGIPNVLLESLACGTGFVASDVGSIREISDAPERDLVSPGDSVMLAQRLADRLFAPEAVTTEIPDVSASAAKLAGILRTI
jgi:hypothetical protein